LEHVNHANKRRVLWPILCFVALVVLENQRLLMVIGNMKYIEASLFFFGLGVALHGYAFVIAWGAAKGWAKVRRVTTINLYEQDNEH
jgi:hypothetical protein